MWLIHTGRTYLTEDDSIGSLAHFSHAQTFLHLTMSVNIHSHIPVSTTNTAMLYGNWPPHLLLIYF